MSWKIKCLIITDARFKHEELKQSFFFAHVFGGVAYSA